MFKIQAEQLPILLFNIIPIVGVAWYNWAPFEMFWLFWVETLIIAFFNAIRIAFSQGLEQNSALPAAGMQLNIAAAIKYLLIRTAIFLFYSLFIITFIGILGSNKKTGISGLAVLMFANPLFNLALLLIMCAQVFYLVKYFFMNGAYYTSKSNQFASIFDGRQIVIHIAVVIGALGTSFLFKDRESNYGAVWMICIFCIAKTIYELRFAPSAGQQISTTASGS